MKKYTYLMFDVDGTLMDFKKGEDCAIRESLRIHHIPCTPELPGLYSKINDGFWKRFEKGEISREQVLTGRFEELFREIGVDADPEAFEQTYQDLLGQQVFYVEGAVDLIQDLSSRYYLCVMTNGVSRTQYSRLKKNHFDQYFRHIFVSEDTGYQKPMKGYFDYCFNRIPGFSADEALIIGDSLTSDIKGGANAGVDTCWYNPDGQQAGADAVITYEISRLEQLREICP